MSNLEKKLEDWTLEERVARLEAKLEEVVAEHEGRRRDDLKDDVDKLKADVEDIKISFQA